MAKITETNVDKLIPDNKNFNKGTEYGQHLVEESLRKFGAGRSVLLDKNNRLIGGNKVIENAAIIGLDNVIIVETDGNQIVAVKRKDIDLDTAKGREFALADNATGKANLAWDIDTINEQAKMYAIEPKDWGISLDGPEMGDVEEIDCQNAKKLSDRFIIPPFSVLDTKQGIWQQRKNYWLSLGIKSEEGRNEAMTYGNNGKDDVSQKLTDMGSTSIFDPVLCELAYKWFNTPNGKIIDCFAGGSVRGIVAAKLGYEYLGNDLRSEQIEANRINAKEVLQDSEIYPTWTCGDSLHIDTIAKGYEADLLFSCPPYADLEVYSDAKEDLSNMPYKDFIAVYREIIRKSCELLKDDRFAVFVVGDVRDKKGFYQNFVSDTIQAFVDNGMFLYNEMILVNAGGSLAMRAGKQFSASRKVGKQHQNVLVFYKGNPKNIKQNYPELDLSYIQDEMCE